VGGRPALAWTISAALHLAALLLLGRLPALALAPPGEDVAVEIVEVAPPPPPAPAPEPPAPAPAPRAVTPAPRRAPRAESPPPDAPPPPNAPPPPDAAPPARAPVRVGISMSSSTTSGGVAAPAGNTLYGELPREAPAPSEVTPYRSERYVPPTQVTVLPRPLGDCRPAAENFPEEAKRLGLEGVVVLSLDIDENGAIAGARVVEDPGHGFAAAAVRSVRATCRFAPGRRGETPVATTLRYTVRFVLP
jgi:protein TonB